MYQLATAPRGIGQVLDSVFKLMKAAFVPLLGYALIGALIGTAPWVYMYQQGLLVADPAAMFSLFTSAGYWLVILVTMPLSAIVYGAALVRTESIAHGDAGSLGASFARAAPHVLAIVVAMVCYMLAVSIGLLLLVVPGVILAGSLVLFLPSIVLDGKGPIASLKHSHKLVWGNWWRTAAVFTIALIIMYVLMFVIGVVLGLAFAFTGFDPVASMIVDAASSLLGSLLVVPFFCALTVEVYRDLGMRKTGGDLAARIEATSAAR